MLGAMAGACEVGLYDYAEKVSKMPMAVITALGSVVLPRMTEVVAAGREDEGRALVRDTMWFMLACAMALSFGIAAVAPEFAPVFFGEGYGGCVPLMRVLCSIVPLICATNVVGVQWLLPTRRDRDFTVSVSLGAAANVAVNLLAIPRAGALGAAWATVASELVVLAAQARSVRGELPLGRMALSALPFACCGTAMLAAVRGVARALGPSAPTVGGLAIEVAAGAACYLALAWMWCRATRSAELRRVLPRLATW